MEGPQSTERETVYSTSHRINYLLHHRKNVLARLWLYTDQVYKSGSGEPDTDECRDQLTEANAVWRLEDVEIL